MTDWKKQLWELDVQVPVLERKDILVNNPGPIAEGGQGKIFIGSWLKSKVAIKKFRKWNAQHKGDCNAAKN